MTLPSLLCPGFSHCGIFGIGVPERVYFALPPRVDEYSLPMIGLLIEVPRGGGPARTLGRQQTSLKAVNPKFFSWKERSCVASPWRVPCALRKTNVGVTLLRAYAVRAFVQQVRSWFSAAFRALIRCFHIFTRENFSAFLSTLLATLFLQSTTWVFCRWARRSLGSRYELFATSSKSTALCNFCTRSIACRIAAPTT